MEESQLQLHSVFEGVELGVWDWRNGHEMFISEQVPHILGYSDKEVKLTWEFLEKIIIPEDVDKVMLNMTAHLQGEKPYLDLNFRIFDKKKKIKWIHAKGKTIEKSDLNEPLRIIGTIQNITEVKQSEAENERLLTALELSSDAFAIINSKQEYIYLNQAHLDLLGFEKNELLGKKWTHIYDRKEAKRINEKAFPKLIQAGKWSGEAVAKKKNGDALDQSLTFTLMQGNYIISTFKDNSKSKQIEQMLTFAKERAEQAKKSQTDFLSTISHEIRTPLNSIVGITQLLIKNEVDEKQKERLQVLVFSTKNLMALINDILDYNKIEAGKIEFEKIEFSLPQLVKQIKETHQVKANEKGLDLILYLDKNLPQVIVGDPIRLVQVLNNLIDNAIKFTNKGSVRVNIDLQDIGSKQVSIHFLVKDTGIGIPKNKQQHVFNRFTQAGSDITRKYGGSGLGLAITKRLLELQNATIKLMSEEGNGAAFSFSLQFDTADSDNGKKTTEEDFRILKDLNKALILVVEDNPVNTYLIKGYLQQWNTKQEFAENGLIAVEKAKAKKYDLILMDLQMPKMDGIEATQLIKRDSLNTATPVFALTAAALPNIKKKVFEVGMVECIFKPFNADDLYKKMKKHIVQAPSSIPEWLNMPPLPTEEETNLPKSKSSKNQPKSFTLDKFLAVFNGDKAVQQEFLEITINEFQSFYPKYKKAVCNFDVEEMRRLRHRINPNLDLLEFQALIDELNTTRENLLKKTYSQLDVEKSAKKVEQLSKEFIHYAKKYKKRM